MKFSKENELSNQQKNEKSARLIVRNLSFKCNEDSVREHFSKFGDISEVKLLKKGDKLVGCGFVQYASKSSASKAISKLSGNDFMGRPIIVDWAVPKDKFNKLNNHVKVNIQEESEKSIEEEEDTVKEEEKCSPSIASNSKEEEENSSEQSDEESGCDDSDLESSAILDEGSESEEDREDVKKEEKYVNDENEEPVFKKRKLNDKSSEKKHKFKYDPNDISDGRTVFIKNVPFSAQDDDLKKCAEEIGSVIYAIVCVDPLTEHSKGTGFVKYKDKTVVDSLLRGNLKLSINGIQLQPFLALKKNQVDSMKEKKTPKDNRNLYLLREGVIIAGSSAAEGVSEGDMAKRLQLENWKTQTLRNLNKFVSPIRLVVHNLPPFVDDNKLRQIFKEHSPKSSIIKESRIMRNLKDINEHGIGKSKGFGFVSFSKHEHALEALRAVNNNPTIFKELRRPIVGFSIENMAALKLKEKRKERNKDLSKVSPNCPTIKNKGKNNDGMKKNRANSISENLPCFSGNVSKPGVKKMRSRKELSMQAKLHHKSTIERKLSKKKFHYSRKFKSKMKANQRNRK